MCVHLLAMITTTCSSGMSRPIPDIIMLSSDSEPGTPQKPKVRELSSSDSDSKSGSPELDKGGLSSESRYVVSACYHQILEC